MSCYFLLLSFTLCLSFIILTILVHQIRELLLFLNLFLETVQLHYLYTLIYNQSGLLLKKTDLSIEVMALFKIPLIFFIFIYVYQFKEFFIFKFQNNFKKKLHKK